MGKRSQGGQKSRFKDTLKASLKSLDINVDTWEDVAQDRMSWRHSIFEGCQVAEKRRIAEAQRKREQRKTRPTKPTTADTAHVCPTCSRTFRARIGLISHTRTHRIPPPI